MNQAHNTVDDAMMRRVSLAKSRRLTGFLPGEREDREQADNCGRHEQACGGYGERSSGALIEGKSDECQGSDEGCGADFFEHVLQSRARCKSYRSAWIDFSFSFSCRN